MKLFQLLQYKCATNCNFNFRKNFSHKYIYGKKTLREYSRSIISLPTIKAVKRSSNPNAEST